MSTNKSRNMSRKLLASLSSLLMIFALSGCGGSDKAQAPTESKQELVEAPQQQAQASGGFDSEITLPTEIGRAHV